MTCLERGGIWESDDDWGWCYQEWDEDNYQPAGEYNEDTGCWVEVYEDGFVFESCDDGSGSWFDPSTGQTETWSPSSYDPETGCTTQTYNGLTETWCDDGSSYWEDEDGGVNISA